MTPGPGTAGLLQQLEAAVRTGHREEEQRLRSTLARPGDAQTAVQVANVYWRAGRLEETRDLLESTTEAFPGDVRTWLSLAVFLCRSGHFHDALPIFQRAIAVDPDNAAVRHRHGWALSTVGRTEEAIPELELAVRLAPDNAAAHYLLSTLKTYEPDDPHLGQLRDALQLRLKPRQRSRLLFALGRALEQTGEYEEAFEAYTEANRLRRAEFDFDIANEQRQVDWLIARFDATRYRDAATGFDSDMPVFLVGMPRSGSTLLEHMLSCHPEIGAAGETPQFFRSLDHHLGTTLMTGSAQVPLPGSADPLWRDIGRHYVDGIRAQAGFHSRVVDKQLFNYFCLGAIANALPRAKIVYCTRNPEDMAISCFTTAFREGQPWVYDLDELAEALRLHRRLMSHWQNLFPGRIAELRYEDLVDDPEAQLRLLLDHIGLSWDERCLGFASSSRPVETSSRGQVNRPVYRDSLQRWRRFENQLATFVSKLRD